jgi:hypothetical protein
MAGILNAEVAFPQFPALDQFGPNTTLLLHGDGTNGAQNNTFLDSSTNNFTITRNGNTTQGTFSPFSQPNGYWGNFFVESTTSRLRFPSGNILPSTGNFTLECWIWPIPVTNGYSVGLIASQGTQPNTDNGRTGFSIRTNGNVYFSIGESYTLNYNGATVPFYQWSHLAVTRSGTTFTYYINGTAVASNTSSKSIDAGYFNVGTWIDGDGVGYLAYSGYISNLRIVSSVVYSSNFTPSTTPLTAITGTNILTCQSNRFLDNSSNAYAPTVTGTPSVQSFKPFSAPTNYYPAVNGGGAYFDGSGDYLNVAYGSGQMNLTNQDFAIEFWAYIPVDLQNKSLLCQDQSYYQLNFFIDSSVNLIIYSYQSLSSGGALNFTLNLGRVPQGQWAYFTLTRTGSTVAGYINGVRAATASFSGTITAQTGGWNIGAAYSAGGPITGYMSDVRFTIGSNPYGVGTTISIPTAPLTAITNTQFLLSCTNAGIIDSVSQNALETVGNAQVSTTQSKFGGASMYFDASASYLSCPSNPSVAFGTGDFTIEYWMYSNDVSSSTQKGMFQTSDTAGGLKTTYTTGIFMGQGYTGSGNLDGAIRANINGTNVGSSVAVLTTGAWYHVALVRASGVVTIYVNGNSVASGTVSSSVTGTYLAVGGVYSTSYTFNGYIDDFRITAGIARYTQNFTPPQNAYPNYGPLTNIPTVDPKFKNTTLLLHGNGTNGAQNNTFLDSSTNNFTITRNGNTTQGTFTPFSQPNGWWSNYFNGSSDYLSIANNAAFNLGTGDFTIEAWIYPLSVNGGNANPVISQLTGASNTGWLFGTSSTSLWQFSTGSNVIVRAGTVSLNQWTHLAAVRISGTTTLYVNGSSVGSTSSSFNFTDTASLIIGYQSSFVYANCYVSNARVIKGTGYYTANFTPSTLPLTAVTNTSLLTCQSNRFLDNSTNAFTVTPSGSPSTQNFYPFFPPLDYSTAAIGGSGYYDGAGDFLNTPTSGQFTAAGDFTVSCWFYLRSFAASYYAAGGNWSAGTSDEWLIQIANDGSIRFLTSADGTFSSAGVVKLNQWTYFTATRSGTTVTVQVNGTTVRTYTKSDTLGSATKSINIGQQPGNNWPWNGYIADFRLVSGSAVTTIPTAPATAISGTSLLLSCTNGSLIDNTSKYNVETVATAQISTAQSKFGGSSILLSAAGDYLLATPAQVNPLGTGNFTVEYWIYFNSVANQQAAVVYGSGSGNYEPLFGWVDSVGLHLYLSSTGSSWDIASAVQIIPNGLAATGRWYHVAVTRSGSTFRTFCNGNQVSTFTSSAAIYQSTSNINVGRYATGYWINAYFDDIRITNGVSRYNSNFTPPIAQFPNK